MPGGSAPDRSQTVQRDIDTSSDTDAGGAREQKGVGRQVVGAAQFLLERLIVVWRKRSGQKLRPGGEVLAADQVRLDGMAIGTQVVK